MRPKGFEPAEVWRFTRSKPVLGPPGRAFFRSCLLDWLHVGVWLDAHTWYTTDLLQAEFRQASETDPFAVWPGHREPCLGLYAAAAISDLGGVRIWFG